MANTWTIFSRWLGALRWGAVLRFSPLLWCVLFTAPALSAPFTKTFAGTVQSVAHAVARHEIYVSAGNAIAVLDDSSFNVLRSFDVPDGSGSLRLTSDEKQLFFFHGFTQQFAVIDLDSGVRRERPRTADVPNPASAVELGAGRFVGSDFFNTTTLFTMDGNDQISVTAKLRGRLLATDVAHGFLYIAAAEEVQKIDMNDPALPLIARHRANANRALLSPDGQRLFTDQEVFATNDLRPLGKFWNHGPLSADAQRNRLYYLSGNERVVVHTLDTLKLLGEQRYDCQWVPTGRSSLPLLTLPDSGKLLLFADTRLCVVDVPLPAPPVSAGQYVGFSRDMVYVARHDRLFVSRPLDNELAVLDRASLKVRRRLPMLGSPTGLAMSDDGQRVFVALAHGAGLAIVDSTKLTWRMHRYAMPSDVSGLQALVNLGRDRLLALTSGEKLHLALIDASAEPILSFTPFRADATATGVRFDRVHGLLYVSGRTTPDNREILYRIDVNTPTVPQLVASTHSASDGTPLLGLQSMALNPAGTTLVSGNGVAIAPLSFARKYLLRLDGADMTTSHHGAGLLFSADGKTIEYGRSNGFVQRFNAVSGKTLQSRALPCGQNGMDISQMVAAPGVDDLLVRGNDMICSKDKSTPYYPPNDQPITPTPIADKVGDLFPLHANAKWVFQRGKQRLVQRVTGSRMASTRQPIWSLQTADGNREEYRLNADLRGIGARLPKGISVKFARPVTVLAHGDVLDFPYESQTVAHFANAKGETANVDYGFTRTALGYEQVKVPAGSFRALHVRQEEILSPFGEPERRSKADIWLAPGVGPVKIITSNKQSVLVSYAVDSDGDGITARRDNCTIVANANQLDTDADQQGDACDLDDDNDQISDLLDNCQRRVNLDQRDTDFDAIGDACDLN